MHFHALQHNRVAILASVCVGSHMDSILVEVRVWPHESLWLTWVENDSWKTHTHTHTHAHTETPWRGEGLRCPWRRVTSYSSSGVESNSPIDTKYSYVCVRSHVRLLYVCPFVAGWREICESVKQNWQWEVCGQAAFSLNMDAGDGSYLLPMAKYILIFFNNHLNVFLTIWFDIHIQKMFVSSRKRTTSDNVVEACIYSMNGFMLLA